MIDRLYMLLLAAATPALSFPSEGHGELRETESLDGNWEILFDPNNEGRADNWHQEAVTAREFGEFLSRGVSQGSWQTIVGDLSRVR